jgi:hypothetical protein
LVEDNTKSYLIMSNKNDKKLFLPFGDNLADVDDSDRERSFVVTSGSGCGSGISNEAAAFTGIRVATG